MTAEQFKKYEGKRTTGRVSGHDLSGGIIVGYTNDSFPNELLAIDSNSGWTGPHWPNRPIIPNKEYENDYLSGLKNYLWVTVDNVIMEEELDLTKILEGCEGVELWSDIFGKCKLESLDGGCNYEIEVLVLDTIDGDNGYEQFTKYGRLYWCYPNGKCLLWPSETCRDWSQFKKPIKVKDGEIVACADNLDYINIRKYSGGNTCYSSNGKTTWKYIIPFDKFNPNLSKEELKKLSIV